VLITRGTKNLNGAQEPTVCFVVVKRKRGEEKEKGMWEKKKKKTKTATKSQSKKMGEKK
jgi:hypothetical protein